MKFPAWSKILGVAVLCAGGGYYVGVKRSWDAGFDGGVAATKIAMGERAIECAEGLMRADPTDVTGFYEKKRICDALSSLYGLSVRDPTTGRTSSS